MSNKKEVPKAVDILSSVIAGAVLVLITLALIAGIVFLFRFIFL